MSGLLLSRETVDTVLRLITALVLEAIPTGAGAGVTLVDPQGHKTSAAATDPLVERADALQYELGEGPCLAAWAGRSVVRVDDVASDHRWPRWAGQAQGLGLLAALSAPLVAGDTSLGAMKIYSTAEAGAFDSHAERLLTMFAAQAAILVSNIQSQESARRMSEQLKTALRGRDVIGQAKGILMSSREVDSDTAFALLASMSRRENKKLQDVAADLVNATGRRRR